MNSQEHKIAVVTGANTGIGKETARGLAQKGYTVVLACRDVAKGEAARLDITASTKSSRVAVLRLDLADFASTRRFAAEVGQRYGRLHVLANNAGLYTRQHSTTPQGFESTFGVNHLGTFLLTQELLPLLKASAPARIVVVSSNLHARGRMRWDDLGFSRARFSGAAAYNQSKLANVLFTKALARRLEGTGVTVNALHPGVVATELVREYPRPLVWLFQRFLVTPEVGALTSLHVATAPETATISGQYFANSKPKAPAKAALDEEAQEKLWRLSQGLINDGAEARRLTAVGQPPTALQDARQPVFGSPTLRS